MKAKELGIWAGVIGLMIAGCWFLISLVNNSPSPTAPKVIENLPPVSKDDFVKGASESAKVTLIEYADFQCPACAQYFPAVKMLSEEFSRDLRVVYRFLPLTNIHDNAMVAAQAAYAAGLQNKFWEMHDMLYENQTSWSNTQARDIFSDYAKDLELDMNKFEEDIDAQATKEAINAQSYQAISIGINSTPTFFVNGIHIQNPSDYQEFKKIIQDEINKK